MVQTSQLWRPCSCTFQRASITPQILTVISHTKLSSTQLLMFVLQATPLQRHSTLATNMQATTATSVSRFFSSLPPSLPPPLSPSIPSLLSLPPPPTWQSCPCCSQAIVYVTQGRIDQRRVEHLLSFWSRVLPYKASK